MEQWEKLFFYLPKGPGDGGDGNPLPSGMPSPEFGAGPGLPPAYNPVKGKLIKTTITIKINHFFIMLPPYLEFMPLF
ncbi:MAG: hypothetical protein ABIJ31_14675 [Pseudomonadota bacterium]